MSYILINISLIEVVLVLVPALVCIAYVTAAESALRSFLAFSLNLVRNILKYLIFILPFILAFKALYLCWHDDVWTFTYFSQQFISNVPFFGQILSENIWGDNFRLSLDKIHNNQDITQLIFAGGLGGCLGKTILETWFSDYFKLPAVAGPGGQGVGEIPLIKTPLILQSTQGSDLNLGSGSSNVPIQGRTNNRPPRSYVPFGNVPFWKVTLNTFYEEITPGLEQYIRILKKMNDQTLHYTLEVPKNNNDPGITQVSIVQSLFSALQKHSRMLSGSFTGRDAWLSELRHLLSEDEKQQIEEISKKIDKIREDYLKKTESLEGSDLDSIRSDLKQFFDFTNTFRNTVKKELTKADIIMKKGLKEHPLYKKEEIRKMINTDYPKLLKSFHDEDERLKKRFIELFNKPK
jgi:hypothetical protein